ncbi:MAG: SURF1 family protein [Xanthobacteraceae bacterium]|nr:MAG: SURF1 family protein [Xanthobacteraceae bacterium]
MNAAMNAARGGGRWLPAVLTLVVAAAFVALGLWQWQRKAEKAVLNAALAERAHAQPVALPSPAQWPALRARGDEFRRVAVTAAFMPAAASALVFTSGSPLRPDVPGVGAWVFAPARLAGGETVVVNRGFVPAERQDLAAPSDVPQTLIGVLRFPERRGWLTPREQAGKRLWFVRDHEAMAEAHGWGRVAPFYLDLEAPAPPGGLPKPGPLHIQLRDDHLTYALIWFALAFAVVAAFAIWRLGPDGRR